ncbi:undecaprenyl diphosphate synthase [Belliella baltica DSM 15883]|uniref:Isoprenyl transferase n=1 Tax=Belliella baltica (strain DSM 15883 / CIP 108006 / LMG 21964 / BA134) TaxID=866536 RepID=I3Z4B6_BELBD|nr:isoprenyl transferase [Belliella baltica]AFL84084.1 undecaprenyl diphosphate synthase [Belliella baltica DSM 15883]
MKESIDSTKIPQHIAIIMDGNGRWAQKKGAMRVFGHKHALAAVRDTIEAADDLGVKIVTLYAFSTENWSRPADEVSALMEIMINSFISELPRMVKNNVRLTAIGDIQSLPEGMQKNLRNTVETTKNNTGVRVNLALSYSGRWEIEQAVKNIAKKVVDGQMTVEEINQEAIASHLNTNDMPDPELLIRTSGELRISNFLLWQMAYTELYFTDVLWPDFRKEHLEAAILDYQKRERRFGKTGTQIKS